ncbi:MAG: hypothetical protein DRP86_04470 [Candidatus Neomarinimicrobiota bacterium]|nr:hypothetical protein [Candidatus Neomarinimicrobiota bacterium]RKY49896.1 MAG: hypothetical protein DRP86_04470 [Candidatus Neomarinimicrobiota bacterium]
MESVLIPLGIMIPFFGVIAYLVYVSFKEKELIHQEIMKALELGVDVPEIQIRKKVDNLKRGLVLLTFGIALFIALWITTELKYASWALLPVAVGIAYLLYHKYMFRRLDV